MKIRHTQWNKEDAVVLTNSGYEAVILPGYGANCISLIHLPTGDQLLRVPETAEELQTKSNVYGLPVLFPPNRIRDGKFIFLGHQYCLPINEPERENHIHGILHRTPFVWNGEDSFLFRADAKNPYFSFPHAFDMERQYRLTQNGLEVILKVTNRSRATMPCGIGVHASFGLVREHPCFLEIQAEKQWLVDPVRLLPTGSTVQNSPLLSQLRSGKLDPDKGSISVLLECLPQCVIRLKKPCGTWKCTMDKHFRFVMLWNGGGGKHFICPEPQTWVTDAPNLPFGADTTGLIQIQPGESFQTMLVYSFAPESTGVL